MHRHIAAWDVADFSTTCGISKAPSASCVSQPSSISTNSTGKIPARSATDSSSSSSYLWLMRPEAMRMTITGIQIIPDSDAHRPARRPEASARDDNVPRRDAAKTLHLDPGVELTVLFRGRGVTPSASAHYDTEPPANVNDSQLGRGQR
ncbi:hypothetical protein EYZ11_010739 [Aspergillus tanneri]|uniref:Uncharacterized protein n=1 Tax=Aspergillus tanneri TaxID=1220188 RepID=A0A4S3J4K7_9EURO|nr:hypothetical protein EYZ11_010739 [Aspergillus tanneri]